MSEIIGFRDRIIETIRANIPELNVDWYDGLFDEHDVDEWIVTAPAAFVAAVSIPKNSPHQTGEMNAMLRIIVTIVTEDRISARDNDTQCWAYMERLAVLANQSRFGDPNAAPAETPMLKRLRDPVLRREGIALGIVEWDSGFTFGRNRTAEHEYVFNPATGERVVDIPTMNAFLGIAQVVDPRGTRTESLGLRKPDPAFPWPSEDE